MKQNLKRLPLGVLLFLLLFSTFPPPVVYSQSSENVFLYVDYFSHSYPAREWEFHNGDYPYLDNSSSNIQTRWSIGTGWDDFDYYYGFENLGEVELEIQDVRLEFELKGEGNVYFVVNIWTEGYSNLTVVEKYDFGSIATGGLFLWFNQSVGDILNTRERINELRMEAVADIDSTNRYIWCRRARMNVTFVEIDVYPEPPLDDYFYIGMGFFGLGVYAFLPLFLIVMYRRKPKRFWDYIPWSLVLFFIAIGCIIGWLWRAP